LLVFPGAILHICRQIAKHIMQNLKNIIFDYGNVIFLIDFAKVQQAFKNLGIADVDQFYGHRQQDEIFDAFDRGQIDAIVFRDRIRQKAGNPQLTDAQIDAAWNTILTDIADGTHELLLLLKEKYRTFLLSNINEIHYSYIMQYLKEKFSYADNEHLFEKTYYSHLTGMRKPEAGIFNKVLQENKLNPAETLFIDDSPQHLATAQALGMQTFLMTAPDTIADFIKREHLI